MMLPLNPEDEIRRARLQKSIDKDHLVAIKREQDRALSLMRRLEARIRQLEEALRPFALEAKGYPDDLLLVSIKLNYSGGFASVTVRDLRHAKEVLEEGNSK